MQPWSQVSHSIFIDRITDKPVRKWPAVLGVSSPQGPHMPLVAPEFSVQNALTVPFVTVDSFFISCSCLPGFYSFAVYVWYCKVSAFYFETVQQKQVNRSISVGSSLVSVLTFSGAQFPNRWYKRIELDFKATSNSHILQPGDFGALKKLYLKIESKKNGDRISWITMLFFCLLWRKRKGLGSQCWFLNGRVQPWEEWELRPLLWWLKHASLLSFQQIQFGLYSEYRWSNCTQ